MKQIQLVATTLIALILSTSAFANCGGHAPPVSDQQIQKTFFLMESLLKASPEKLDEFYHADRRLFDSKEALLSWARDYVHKGLATWIRREHSYAHSYAQCLIGAGGEFDHALGAAESEGCTPSDTECEARDCNAANPAFPNC